MAYLLSHKTNQVEEEEGDDSNNNNNDLSTMHTPHAPKVPPPLRMFQHQQQYKSASVQNKDDDLHYYMNYHLYNILSSGEKEMKEAKSSGPTIKDLNEALEDSGVEMPTDELISQLGNDYSTLLTTTTLPSQPLMNPDLVVFDTLKEGSATASTVTATTLQAKLENELAQIENVSKKLGPLIQASLESLSSSSSSSSSSPKTTIENIQLERVPVMASMFGTNNKSNKEQQQQNLVTTMETPRPVRNSKRRDSADSIKWGAASLPVSFRDLTDRLSSSSGSFSFGGGGGGNNNNRNGRKRKGKNDDNNKNNNDNSIINREEANKILKARLMDADTLRQVYRRRKESISMPVEEEEEEEEIAEPPPPPKEPKLVQPKLPRPPQIKLPKELLFPNYPIISFDIQSGVSDDTILSAALTSVALSVAMTGNTDINTNLALAGTTSFLAITKGLVGDCVRGVGDITSTMVQWTREVATEYDLGNRVVDVTTGSIQLGIAVAQGVGAVVMSAMDGAMISIEYYQKRQAAAARTKRAELTSRRLLEERIAIEGAQRRRQKEQEGLVRLEQERIRQEELRKEGLRKDALRVKDSLQAENRRALMEYRFALEAEQRIRYRAEMEAAELLRQKEQEELVRVEQERIRQEELRKEELRKQALRVKDSLEAENRRALMEYRFAQEAKQQRRKSETEAERFRRRMMQTRFYYEGIASARKHAEEEQRRIQEQQSIAEHQRRQAEAKARVEELVRQAEERERARLKEFKREEVQQDREEEEKEARFAAQEQDRALQEELGHQAEEEEKARQDEMKPQAVEKEKARIAAEKQEEALQEERKRQAEEAEKARTVAEEQERERKEAQKVQAEEEEARRQEIRRQAEDAEKARIAAEEQEKARQEELRRQAEEEEKARILEQVYEEERERRAAEQEAELKRKAEEEENTRIAAFVREQEEKALKKLMEDIRHGIMKQKGTPVQGSSRIQKLAAMMLLSSAGFFAEEDDDNDDSLDDEVDDTSFSAEVDPAIISNTNEGNKNRTMNKKAPRRKGDSKDDPDIEILLGLRK